METSLILYSSVNLVCANLYADWLDENGKGEEAEYLRIELNDLSSRYSNGYMGKYGDINRYGSGNGYGGGYGHGNGNGSVNGNGHGNGIGYGYGYGYGIGNGSGNGNRYGNRYGY